MLSPCLFNLYSEYILRNAELEEAQASLKPKANQKTQTINSKGFPGGSDGKESAWNAGDLG